MIREFHPLYLLGVMLLLLSALIWQNSKIQDEIAYELSERANARTMATGIVELKKVMKSPNQSQLDHFLQGPVFAGAELSHRIKNGRYIIQARQMSARQLQSFLNRVFNMNVEVSSLKLETVDDKHVALKMEISI